MSSLLGVGMYPHGYRWGNTSCNLLCYCRLHFPVDIMVCLQSEKEGVTGKISIWGKSRKCINSRGDWLGCMIISEIHVTPHWRRAASNKIFLSAGCSLPPKAWGVQPLPCLATPWLKKTHILHSLWNPCCRFLYWVISSCLHSVSEPFLPDFHRGMQ